LAKRFPTWHFDGVDYVPEMVAAAQGNALADGVSDRVRFFEGDALKICDNRNLAESYDVVFTDRCLINLDTLAKQKAAIQQIARKVRPGGHLLMIENSLTTYGQQNKLREALGLKARSPAEFNLFFDEEKIRPHIAACGLQLTDVEDFSSLHDLLLYVMVPAINGGTVDYEHPLVAAAAKLSIESKGTVPTTFGNFGQNRMFVCRK
jgi:SAM-dependent methyltransferase